MAGLEQAMEAAGINSNMNDGRTAFDIAKADELTARVMEERIKRTPELLRQVLEEKGLDREIAELARGEK